MLRRPVQRYLEDTEDMQDSSWNAFLERSKAERRRIRYCIPECTSTTGVGMPTGFPESLCLNLNSRIHEVDIYRKRAAKTWQKMLSNHSSKLHNVMPTYEVKFVPYRPSRHRGEIEAKLHSVSTSALEGGEWLRSCSGRFTPRKNPGPHGSTGRFGEKELSSDWDSNSGPSSTFRTDPTNVWTKIKHVQNIWL